jgi:hypothetical protein
VRGPVRLGQHGEDLVGAGRLVHRTGQVDHADADRVGRVTGALVGLGWLPPVVQGQLAGDRRPATGDRAAVAAAVEGFFERLLADPVLSGFFSGGGSLGVPGHIVGIVAGLRPAVVTV